MSLNKIELSSGKKLIQVVIFPPSKEWKPECIGSCNHQIRGTRRKRNKGGEKGIKNDNNGSAEKRMKNNNNNDNNRSEEQGRGKRIKNDNNNNRSEE